MIIKMNGTSRLVTLLLCMVALSVKAEVTAFEHINVIPMDSEVVLKNKRVIIDNDKILSIEDGSKVASIQIDHSIDSRGQYMLPSFSETHYHLTSNADEEYKLLLANGVTAVRNMAEYKEYEEFGIDILAIKKQATQIHTLSPYFYTAGPLLTTEYLKTEKDALDMVNYHKAHDYDFIKIHGNLPEGIYLELLEAADKLDLPVIGHAQRHLPLEYSLRMKSIAHIEEFMYMFSKEQLTNELFLKKLTKQVKDSGVFLSPTLSTFALIARYADDVRFSKLKSRPETRYLAYSNLKEWASDSNSYRQQSRFTSAESISRLDNELALLKKLTLAMHTAGVPLMVGSDTYGLQVPGFSIHDEMQLMNEAGLPSYAVLKAATVTASRYLGRYATSGTISKGKIAEFVVLNGNPLSNIKNTRKIAGVMHKGQWLDRKSLDELLLQVIEARSIEDKG